MKAILATLIVLVNCGIAVSQITGQVKDFKTGSFIKGAEVFIGGSQIKAVTDQNGFFNLEGLPNGSYTVGCYKSGYTTAFQWSASKYKQSSILFILQKDDGKAIKDAALKNQITDKLMDKGTVLPEWMQGCRIKQADLKTDVDKNGKERIYGKVMLDNNTLGYSIVLHLRSYAQDKLDYQLQFSPLFGLDEQKQQWEDYRFAAYQFSVQNFLEAVLQGTTFQNGYTIFGANEKLVKPDTLLHVGYTGQNNYLKLNDRIKIVHVFNGATYTSWISALGRVDFSDLGLILNSDSVKLEGAMTTRNLAMQLPYEFSPPAGKKLFSLAQYFEKTYVHTDKQYYYPGDTLWFKAYMNYQTLSLIESLSKVLYVELLDSLNGGRIIDKKTLKIDDGEAWGEFILPDSLPTSVIALRAYTNWQRNFGDDQCFIRFFPFMNRNANLDSERKDLMVNNKVKIKQAKPTYYRRDKVQLSVSMTDDKNQPISAWMSVSVTDLSMVKLLRDSTTILQKHDITKVPEASRINYPLERGLKIGGQYLDHKRNPTKVNLSAMLGKCGSFQFETDVYGKFAFEGLDFNDTLAISFTARQGKYTLPRGKIKLDSVNSIPYGNITWPLITNVPEPADYKIDKHVTLLKDVVIRARRYQTKTAAEQMTAIKNKPPFGEPDYVLDNKRLNTGLPNVIEMLRGKIPGLLVSFDGSNYSIRSNRSGTFTLSTDPIVMIDDQQTGGSAVQTLLAVNPPDVVSIEVILRLTALAGSSGGNGIISIYTKGGGLRGRFEEQEVDHKMKVMGYSTPLAFRGFDHSDNVMPLNSDYRPTLYWNPSAISSTKNGPAIISFYASDSTGPYLITIEGLTAEGKPFRTEKQIEIQD
jgi:hypothetical protein